jgi:hypothetical protein
MKHFLTAVLCMALTSFAFAQNMEHRHTFTAHAGLNLFNLVTAGADNVTPEDITIDNGGTINFSGATVKSIPTWNLTYDYAIQKWFSIGASVGHNRISMEFTNLDYNGPENQRITGSGGFSAGRTSINVRPLFHYGNSGRLDMYSGFRLGFSIWGARAIGNLQGENIDDQLENFNFGGLRGNVVLPQFALTAFGLRGYFTENFGLGFEINIGSPYMLSAGANYRF